MAAGTGKARREGRGRPRPGRTRRGGDTLPGREQPLGALAQCGCPQTYPTRSCHSLLLIFLPGLLPPTISSHYSFLVINEVAELSPSPTIPHSPAGRSSSEASLEGGSPGMSGLPCFGERTERPRECGNLSEVAQQLSGRIGTGSQLS